MEAKLLILGQIWGKPGERLLKELSNALFRDAVPLLVPELSVDLAKNVEKGKIWPLMTSGDLVFDLT